MDRTHPLGCILGTVALLMALPSIILIVIGWRNLDRVEPEAADMARESLELGTGGMILTLCLCALCFLAFRHKLPVKRGS